jgi:16S rRNA (cytosine1402-N4)-methyltransferase
MAGQHLPVMVAEVLEYLAPRRETGLWWVDATLGLGGHAEAILEAAPEARLLGIDQDPEALRLAAERLARFGERFQPVQGNHRDLAELLAERGVEKVAGVLADLGVSSLQLDTPERGFSFRADGPLDMRMGPDGMTAAEIVNSYEEADLERIFRELGEERQARRIARNLVAERTRQPLRTTGELKAVIARAKGREHGPREGRVDPATRVFQALRIEVNQELDGLEKLLDQAVQLIEADGRLVIISFHSLEDRIVKNAFRDLARGEIDQVTGRSQAESQLIEALTRKPVRPSAAEERYNPRSRSARLRAARRL